MLKGASNIVILNEVKDLVWDAFLQDEMLHLVQHDMYHKMALFIAQETEEN